MDVRAAEDYFAVARGLIEIRDSAFALTHRCSPVVVESFGSQQIRGAKRL